MPQKTYMYDTQWNQLINAINTGDSSAIVTAISNIKTSIDNIYTRLNAVGFNSTQWDNLVDSINNQSITVDLSNINSDNVSNLSNVTGGNITNALNYLNSNLLKSKDVTVAVGSVIYDGYYIADEDTGLSTSSKLVSVQVVGTSGNHAAFVGYYQQSVQRFRVNCVVPNSTVYVRVWYI